MTVGFGISPNLLTFCNQKRSRAYVMDTYRRWGISPRPENVATHTGSDGSIKKNWLRREGLICELRLCWPGNVPLGLIAPLGQLYRPLTHRSQVGFLLPPVSSIAVTEYCAARDSERPLETLIRITEWSPLGTALRIFQGLDDIVFEHGHYSSVVVV
jgi:hypothetical protein